MKCLLLLLFVMKVMIADIEDNSADTGPHGSTVAESLTSRFSEEDTAKIATEYTIITEPDDVMHTLATEADYITVGEPTTEVEEKVEHDIVSFDKELTVEAFNSLTNSTNRTLSFPKNISVLDPETQQQYIQWEWSHDLRHFGNEKAFLRVCYYLTTTYRNAMLDLRKYYQIRYLYYDNVEYEIGYVTHEIVFKYQIILELFHLIQRKFELHMDRHFAPTTYMLYIYTNILFQSTDIIHLCNMMHEIENKYKNYKSKGPFADVLVPETGLVGNRTEMEKERAIAAYKKKLEAIQKRIRKEQKKRMKMIEKGKIFSPTIRTTRTYKKFWDLHYGWSIETW